MISKFVYPKRIKDYSLTRNKFGWGYVVTFLDGSVITGDEEEIYFESDVGATKIFDPYLATWIIEALRLGDENLPLYIAGAVALYLTQNGHKVDETFILLFLRGLLK